MIQVFEKDLQEEDIEFFEREIESFLPDRIFDAHAHLGTVPGYFPSLVGHAEYFERMIEVHCRQQISAVFISRVGQDMNEWVSKQAAVNPTCRGLFFAKPEDDEEWVRQEVSRLGLCGIKCYHTMARSGGPTWEAEIPSYLPEKLVRVADEEDWAIMLHLVRSRAVADPSNIHWIKHYCRRYPNMKLILAHSARGFQPSHNMEGLPQLKGLDNLYFDTSANCEPIAHQAIIRYMGHEKLLYGTDFPVSHKRGRSVGVGDSFVWLYGEMDIWNEKHAAIKPVLIGLEHLRSLKWVCWSEKLGDSKIEDIFWNNPARVFGVR